MAVAAAAMARTIIVAADGSGEFTRIANGVDVAEPGDTVLVRPGDYWDERFVVDSAVIVMAEQQGQATVWLDPSIGPVTLHSRAELRGFVIVGNFMGINQIMVGIYGDAAVVDNCYFDAFARYGWQLLVASHNVASTVVHCRFDFEYGNPNDILWHRTLLDMWMPFNCYGDGVTDTSRIHTAIDDHFHGDTTVGYVYVTPVWEEFQWLAVDDRRPDTRSPSEAVRIYPNPSYGVINLALDNGWRLPEVTVYNILGQRVMAWSGAGSAPGSQGALTLHLDRSLPSGSYIVEIATPPRVHRVQFVLCR